MSQVRNEPSTESRALGIAAQPRTLTTWKIVGLILAVLTPLTALTATVPLGLGFGGPATALMFLVSGIVYALFCVGYATMVRRISRPGAFYNYIARGLGRPAGVGAAMTGVVIYVVSLIGAYAAGAYICTQMLLVLGIELNWIWVLVIVVVAIALLVWRQIELNAVIGGVVVGVEILLVLSLVIAIIVNSGAGAFDLDVISPKVFTQGDWAVAFIFAILNFQGFETGALYAPEAKRPEKTVPRALYLALIITVGLLFLASWVLTSVTGPAELQAAVVEAGFVGYILAAVQTYLGTVGLWIFAITAIVATFLVMLTGTNFQARYLNGLAKDDLLPRYLSGTNRFGAPAAAAYTIMGTVVAVLFVSLLAGIDPYVQLTPISFGLAAFGSVVLLVLSSIAVIGFFRRRPRDEAQWWHSYVAPALATVLLIAAAAIMLGGFEYVTGSAEPWMRLLPLALLAVFVIGVAFGFWLKRRRPSVYRDIAQGDTAEEALDIRRRRLFAEESE